MSKKSRCLLGKEIEKRLIDLDKNKKWLIEKVREDTGLFFDGAYLQKILTGKVKATSIVTSILKILDMQTNNNLKAVVTNNDDEVLAIIGENEIVEKEGYKVTIVN